MLEVNNKNFRIFYKTDENLILIKNINDREVYFFDSKNFIFYFVEDNDRFYSSYIRHIKKDENLLEILKKKKVLKEVDSFIVDNEILSKIY
jgi:hypothetical protein